MSKYVFFDVETRKSSTEVGGWFPEEMELSLAVTYDYDNGYESWMADDVELLLQYLNAFEYIIGFNQLNFDYKVLSTYDEASLVEDLEEKTIDLLLLVEQEIGYKVSLDALASCTLGQQKSGNGLHAVKLWKQGRIKELSEYCKQDVALTKALFEFVQTNKVLYHMNKGKKTAISIDLPEEATETEVNVQETKIWLDGYFESLLLGDSISKGQILLLRNKVQVLFKKLEAKPLTKGSDEEETVEVEEQEEIPYYPPSPASIDEVADDLPF